MKSWIVEARKDFRKASEELGSYQDLVSSVLANLRVSETPFTDYCGICSHLYLYADSALDCLNQRILNDDPLRTTMANHALIDPIPMITKSVREFTRALSIPESLDYNNALFDRLMAHESNSNRGLGLGALLSTARVDPLKIEDLVMQSYLLKAVADSGENRLGLAFHAINALVLSDDFTQKTHAVYLDVLEDVYPPTSDGSKQVFTAWGKIEKTSATLTPAEKLLVFSCYHAAMKDHEFDLQAVGVMAVQSASRWVQRSEFTPEDLAAMTITDAQGNLCRMILESPADTKRYIQALRGDRLLEASIAADLGL